MEGFQPETDDSSFYHFRLSLRSFVPFMALVWAWLNVNRTCRERARRFVADTAGIIGVLAWVRIGEIVVDFFFK